VRTLIEGQVISYSWQEQRPTLQIRSNNEIGNVLLDEYSLISIKASEERRCVGTYINGEHRACPHNSLTRSADRCPECTYKQFFRNCDILNVELLKQGKNCIFNPLCSKEELSYIKRDLLCCKIHVVYLAVFGDIMKVGITQNKRLYQRMIEQGADAFIPVLSARNRAEAREIENAISKEIGVSQIIRGSEICKTLANYDEQKSDSSLLERAEKICEFRDVPVPNFKVIKLGSKYSLPELITNPILLDGFGFKGEVIGTKGRLLIFEDYSQSQRTLEMSKLMCATDLSKLVGRTIKMFGNRDNEGDIY